ncbi:MAG: DUF4124 domain-containing protein [Agarilytica sp.]
MKRTFLIALPIAALLASLSSIALAKGEYYRWTSDDGVVHYGARPPEGVNAELISTWGKSAGENKAPAPGQNKEKAEAAPEEKKKQLAAARKQQCEDERQRLKALQTPGRRIRMEQPDGSVRYLSSDELAAETARSKDFVNQACN